MDERLENVIHQAYTGESKASLRLKVYAEKADKEGYPQLAKLFRVISFSEELHGKRALRLLKEIKSTDQSDYHSLVALRLRAKDKVSYFAGTLFSKKDPRIVVIDDFKVEIVPDGELLLMYNNDKPGVIGNIGTLLGESGINIARMHFGRETAGGKAISVVSIDSTPTPEIIQKIKTLPNILSVRQICL